MKIKDIAKYGIIACVLVSASATAQKANTLPRNNKTPPDLAQAKNAQEAEPRVRDASDFIHEMIDPCVANPELKRCKYLKLKTKKNI